MFRMIVGTFLILTQSLFAQALTISGDVRDASDNPLVSNSVTFEFSILNPAQNCVLYRETHFRDMSASGGFFSAELGSGSAAYNGNTTLENVFGNAGALNCEGGGTYSPVASDRRLVKIGFNAGAGWRYIADLVPITQAAWAMHSKVSENSQKLNGLSASSYLLKPGAACAGVVGFDGTTLTCSPIAGLAVDWSSLVNKPSTFTPSAHTHSVTQITSNSAGDYFNYTPNGTACAANDILKWDGARWVCGFDSAGTPGINALTGDVTASGSGSVPATVVSIGGKTAAQVATAVNDISAVPTTYLSRAGGMMTGALDMNQQNIINTGMLTMYPGKSLHLSNNSVTPAALTGADRGKVWYNSTSNKVEYWDGATAKALGIEGGVASDLTSITGTGLVQRTGGASYNTLGLGSNFVITGGITLDLTSSGVTSGTYGSANSIPSFTVNDKGLITTATSTPLNWSGLSGKPTTLGGYGITDALSSTTGGDVAGSVGIKSAQSLKLWNSSNTFFAALKAPPLSSSVTWTLPMSDGSSGQTLATDGFGTLYWANAGGASITSINGLTAPNQLFAVSSAGTAPSWSSNSSTHTLNLPMASAASVGAGMLSNSDYNLFLSKVDPSYTFPSGDLSGSISNPSVNKIRGTNVDSTTPITGQVLTFDGGAWRPQAPYINNSFASNMVLATPDGASGPGSFRFIKRPDIKSTVSGDFFGNTSCGLGQALVYFSASDQILCQNIMISDGNIDSSRALWSRNGANIHWPTGNVGIGTSTPSVALDVVGSVGADNLKIKNGGFQTTIGSSATSNYTILLPYQLPADIRPLLINNSGQILYGSNPAAPTYTFPSLLNSYAQAASADLGLGYSPATISYWKDDAGMVHLRGIHKGANNATIFVLGAGYLPTGLTILPTATQTGICKTFILPNGEVKPGADCSLVWTALDGISFKAAP